LDERKELRRNACAQYRCTGSIH